MNWMEVALLILGVGAFAASFIIPEKKSKDAELYIDTEVMQKMIAKQIEEAKGKVSEVVDETLDYAIEKTERASERISNEKIMAINEYSETVMAEINKVHQEVMFLYDMLNDKHKNIKETVKIVDKQAKEAEEKVNAVAVKLAVKEEASAMIEEKLQKSAQTAGKIVAQAKTTAPQTEQRVTLDMLGAAVSSKNVEVYSFVNQAPHIERTESKQLQAEKMKHTVTEIREKQAKKEEIKKPAPEVKENNNDKILKLYKMGMDSVAIAKELGLGVGEVKLVINLFKGAV